MENLSRLRPRDTVDSIMSIEGWGPVQNRGESCRSERPDKNGETRTPRGLSAMSQDSIAAPESARKLSGRRRREVVAVLLFSGGPIFESSIPLSVFGIDRQDAGVPRYRLLVCAGEDGPLRTTGGLELSAPYGLEAISRAGTVVVAGMAVDHIAATTGSAGRAAPGARGGRENRRSVHRRVRARRGRSAGRPPGHHTLDVRADARQALSVRACGSA